MLGNNDSAVWCLELAEATAYWHKAVMRPYGGPAVRVGHSMEVLNETAMVMVGGVNLDTWGRWKGAPSEAWLLQVLSGLSSGHGRGSSDLRVRVRARTAGCTGRSRWGIAELWGCSGGVLWGRSRLVPTRWGNPNLVQMPSRAMCTRAVGATHVG